MTCTFANKIIFIFFFLILLAKNVGTAYFLCKTITIQTPAPEESQTQAVTDNTKGKMLNIKICKN